MFVIGILWHDNRLKCWYYANSDIGIRDLHPEKLFRHRLKTPSVEYRWHIFQCLFVPVLLQTAKSRLYKKKLYIFQYIMISYFTHSMQCKKRCFKFVYTFVLSRRAMWAVLYLSCHRFFSSQTAPSIPIKFALEGLIIIFLGQSPWHYFANISSLFNWVISRICHHSAEEADSQPQGSTTTN